MAKCEGSPTFNQIYPNSITEWPAKIPGWICKTAPFGIFSAPRFAECCSGKVYNITAPTTPDDPAYPMSCALVCQVDPALMEGSRRSKDRPLGFDDHMMCLTDGLEIEAGEVVCALNTVPGVEAPTSFPSTPSGEWKTKDWDKNCEENYLDCVDPFTMSDWPLGDHTETAVVETAEPTASGDGTEATASASDDAVAGTTDVEAPATSTEASGGARAGLTWAYWAAPLLLVNPF